MRHAASGLGAFFHAAAVSFGLGGAFLIGCAISIARDPWGWIKFLAEPAALVAFYALYLWAKEKERRAEWERRLHSGRA